MPHVTVPDDMAGRRSRSSRPSARSDLELVAGIILSELCQADTPLTVAALCDRTLLPEAMVHPAISDLTAAGLVTPVHRASDRQPVRFVATLPSSVAPMDRQH